MNFKIIMVFILFGLNMSFDNVFINANNKSTNDVSVIERIKDENVYIASYYHDKYNGRLGANGKTFYQDSLTCAHRTLPFGTMVEVTNESNNKSVILEVTDRGPFVKGREIDLSRRAASELDFINKGLEKVKIRIIN